MLIRTGYEFVFHVETPSLMLMMVALHPDREHTVRRHSGMVIEPYIPFEEFSDVYGNRCRRIFAPAGRLRLYDEMVVEDSGSPTRFRRGCRSTPARICPRHPALPVEQPVLRGGPPDGDRLGPFRRGTAGLGTGPGRLQLGARECPLRLPGGPANQDGLRRLRGAGRRLPRLRPPGADLVPLVHSRAVCHGYLGDIGIPPVPSPMDFSGWFEVFLGGRWHTFDARHNVPRIGRVLMARGRDAADVAMTTSFGKNTLGAVYGLDGRGPVNVAKRFNSSTYGSGSFQNFAPSIICRR